MLERLRPTRCEIEKTPESAQDKLMCDIQAASTALASLFVFEEHAYKGGLHKWRMNKFNEVLSGSPVKNSGFSDETWKNSRDLEFGLTRADADVSLRLKLNPRVVLGAVSAGTKELDVFCAHVDYCAAEKPLVYLQDPFDGLNFSKPPDFGESVSFSTLLTEGEVGEIMAETSLILKDVTTALNYAARAEQFTF